MASINTSSQRPEQHEIVEEKELPSPTRKESIEMPIPAAETTDSNDSRPA